MRSVTHFVPRSAGFANAFWDPPTNAMYYGDGDDSDAPLLGALDVVAHELTHGVTQYTWDGIYAGESGALDEAFSDIMATGVEFFQEPPGTGRLQADYFLGEDLSFVFDPPRRAVRSMENPSLFCSAALGACDPDHYSRRYRGPLDNGGVHHNSGIANQAFYLLIEGGTNRTSGRHVAGLGAAKPRAGRAHLLPRLHVVPDALGHVRRRTGRHPPGRAGPLRGDGGGAGRRRLGRGGGRVRRAAPLAAALAVALAGAADAADEHGFFVSLGGGAAVGSLGWTSSATWTEYAETARVDASYEAGSGPALEAGLGYRVSRRVGLAVSFGWARRDADARVEASLPHPLYLDRPRSVQGQANGLQYRELASHLDLLLVPLAGRLEVALFGGPCLLRVDADQVVRVEFDEEYPYDEATFRSAVTSARRGRTRPSAGARGRRSPTR